MATVPAPTMRHRTQAASRRIRSSSPSSSITSTSTAEAARRPGVRTVSLAVLRDARALAARALQDEVFVGRLGTPKRNPGSKAAPDYALSASSGLHHLLCRAAVLIGSPDMPRAADAWARHDHGLRTGNGEPTWMAVRTPPGDERPRLHRPSTTVWIAAVVPP